MPGLSMCLCSAADAQQAGNLAIPLCASLPPRCESASAEASRSIHFGATSQDVLDTALMLQTREALALILTKIDRVGRIPGRTSACACWHGDDGTHLAAGWPADNDGAEDCRMACGVAAPSAAVGNGR